MDLKNFRIEKILAWLEESFPFLKSKRPLQSLILVAFTIVLFALGIMGYFAYSNVQELTEDLQEVAQPNDFVEKLNDAIKTQSDIDGFIMQYMVGKDEDRLMGNYFVNLESISQKLKELKKLDPPNDSDTARMQKIETAFAEKLWKHTQLMRLVADSSLSAQFATMVSQFTKFKGIGIKETPKDTAFAVSLLLAEDKSLMKNLRARIENLENRYRRNRELKAERAEQQKTRTLRLTALFSLFVLTISAILLSIIFNDLNRNRELQQRLRREKQRAEKLARVKEDFLANMSHEIRTPMNAIMGFAGQLAETPLQDKQQKLLQPIQNSAKYLLALLNDILDYSKLESEQFTLEKIGFKPRKVLSDVQSTFGRLAKKKNIELAIEVDPETPEILIGDPIRLKQMLFNLVSNALKFTEEGRILVKLIMGKKRRNQVWMDFVVKDTGIGIAKEKLNEIFSEFSQADNSISRRYGGTGLGLSITKKLALMHGGNIQLDSEPNKGTRVILHLNYLLGDASDLLEEQQVVKVQPDLLKGHKIIAADDEPYNRLLIKSILSKWNLEVSLCENGKELIELIQKEPYSLVLMDLQMPELDGIATTKYLRQELQMDIPIIALTATSTPDEINRALAAGMQAHLIKPFEEGELYQLMCQLLEAEPILSKAKAETVTAKKEIPMAKPDTPFDLEKLARLSNQNKSFMQNMLGIFVKSTEENLQGIEQAQKGKDYLTISQKVHKIIPPCRHLGMYELVGRLKELELELKKPAPATEFISKIDPIKEELKKILVLVKKEMD
ncbi:MAG: ATP-binding protein [Bacteroidota bacterium]